MCVWIGCSVIVRTISLYNIYIYLPFSISQSGLNGSIWMHVCARMCENEWEGEWVRESFCIINTFRNRKNVCVCGCVYSDGITWAHQETATANNTKGKWEDEKEEEKRLYMKWIKYRKQMDRNEASEHWVFFELQKKNYERKHHTHERSKQTHTDEGKAMIWCLCECGRDGNDFSCVAVIVVVGTVCLSSLTQE